ncbi:MAG: helical backbone metal receptor [Pseudomonadota bacterium]
MKRRALLHTALSSLAWAALGCQHAAVRTGTRRIVSLSPAFTETLYATGAEADLVGVSDYCNYPEVAKKLPRNGSALTPNYEAIVRLAPTLILCEAAAAAPRRELSALSVTRFLPWLTLEDIVASTRLLGALTDRAEAASALAERLWDGLAVAENPAGPRVLAVLGEGQGKLSEIYFIKRNSIHGAALRAAGARNAVAADAMGVPRLSLEELLHLDPDGIIVLIAPGPHAPSDTQVLQEYQALEPLRARRNNRISVLKSDEAFGEGPRILNLAEQLRREVQRLFGNPAPSMSTH